MKTVVVLLCLLLGTAVSSSGVIVISSEPHDQYYPQLAFGPDTFLVAWFDERNGGSSWGIDVYAARVTLQGDVLEPRGIPVAVDSGFQKFVGPLVWDGDNWFVYWAVLGLGGNKDGPVMGARVTRDGVVLDPGGKPLLNYYAQQWYPAASFDGQYYFLVWYDARQTGTGPGLYATRITRDLKVLDPDGIFLWGGPLDSPVVSYDGQNYCVAWDEFQNHPRPKVYAGRVRPDGVVLDTVPIELFSRENTDGVHTPDIAFGGGVYFIVASRDTYIPGQDHPPLDILGARITPQGSLLDSTAIMVSTIEFPRITFRYPAYLDYNGQFFQVIWYRDGGSLLQVVEGARVEPSGRVLDTTQMRVVRENTGVQWGPNLAYGRDGKCLLVWSNGIRLPDSADVYGCFVDTTGRQVMGVEGLTPSGVPLRFDLSQNVPNPWVSGTRFSYTLPHEDQVVLGVYNPMGQLVRTLFKGKESGGYKQVAWDGRDDVGRKVPSGVYFYRIQAGAFSDTKKMVLIR